MDSISPRDPRGYDERGGRSTPWGKRSGNGDDMAFRVERICPVKYHSAIGATRYRLPTDSLVPTLCDPHRLGPIRRLPLTILA